LLLAQLTLEIGPEFSGGALGPFEAQQILDGNFGTLFGMGHAEKSGTKVFAQLALQELFGVVQSGTNGAFGAFHDFSYLRVAQTIDFK